MTLETTQRLRAAFIIKPLPDDVLWALFEQSTVGYHKGEPPIDGIRRLARLLELELQAQIFVTARRRASDDRRRLAETTP